MSATIQESLFVNYFDSCPIVYVKGRTFPVVDHYLPEVRRLVEQGQKLQASQRGKNTSFNFVKNKDKKGNVDINQQAIAIRPPKFDPDLIAELVIRIITTHSQGTDRMANIIKASDKVMGKDVKKSKGEAILVFLSGIQAIEKVNKALRQREILKQLNAVVHILHGTLAPEQQRRVFRTTDPGEWKVILATNIAETSITIDDVTHVVDSGFVKEMR